MPCPPRVRLLLPLQRRFARARRELAALPPAFCSPWLLPCLLLFPLAARPRFPRPAFFFPLLHPPSLRYSSPAPPARARPDACSAATTPRFHDIPVGRCAQQHDAFRLKGTGRGRRRRFIQHQHFCAARFGRWDNACNPFYILGPLPFTRASPAAVAVRGTWRPKPAGPACICICRLGHTPQSQCRW